MPLYSYAVIQSIIPHRYPFLLVDAVISLQPGVAIETAKCITGSEPCYAHVPDRGEPERMAYPCSLIVESFGQSGAILWLLSAREQQGGARGVLMFAASKGCHFSDEAFPGDVLTHTVQIERVIGDNVFLRGETHVADRLVMRIEQALAVVRPAHVLGR